MKLHSLACILLLIVVAFPLALAVTLGYGKEPESVNTVYIIFSWLLVVVDIGLAIFYWRRKKPLSKEPIKVNHEVKKYIDAPVVFQGQAGKTDNVA